MGHVRFGLRLGVTGLTGTLATAALGAPVQTTLFSFAGGTDAAYPNGPLLPGASGVLYGVSQDGGAFGDGTVFALTPPVAGQGWTEQVIYSFQGATDGDNPSGGLVRGTNGVLYGTAEMGGAGGAGTVFALTPPAAGFGSWTETTLHAFMGGTDGEFPSEDAGLALDTAGNLYGTTINGGARSGIAFRLSPPATGSGVWTETILHAFQGGDDGYFPEGGVKLSANGVLYGTTSGGGASFTCSGGCGTVFSLTPPAAGHTMWKHAVLHAMTEIGGSDPSSSLISDVSGNLYGTALLGGTSTACSSTGCGTVFRVLPPTSSAPHWVLQTLHSFSSGSDSEFPYNAVLLTGGKLWGATAGASPNRLGATFTIAPPPTGGTIPVESIIHTFQGGSTDGATPSAGLTLGVGGVLYGVTSRGGSGSHGVCGDGCGTMFEIAP